MKNLDKVLIMLLIGGLGFIGYKVINSQKLNKNKSKIQADNKPPKISLTKGCIMTTFDGRLECFKERILENRKRNPSIPKQYQIIGKNYYIKLLTEDKNDILQIEKPQDLSITNCIANSILFDWNDKFFFIAPDSFNSGAICESNKGRVAILPMNLTNDQIKEFYSRLLKK